MKKWGKNFMVAVAAIALITGLSSCQKNDGPAERAGKKVDQTVEKAGQQMEKAGDKIGDATKK